MDPELLFEIKQYLSEKKDDFEDSLVENSIYPPFQELLYLQRNTLTAINNIEKYLNEKKEMPLLEGLPLEYKEEHRLERYPVIIPETQEKLRDLLLDYLNVFSELIDNFNKLRNTAFKELTLNIYQGFCCENKVYPRSHSFALVTPQKEDDRHYAIFGARMENSEKEKNWIVQSQGFVSLEEVLDMAEEETHGRFYDVYYVENAQKYPLNTILTIIEWKYTNFLTGESF